ncbi:MAG: ATP-binding protein [Candidatus Zophobacter franzmannii]|nr:ATP-binding protein [Candidatus Zophobacter franzmannii]
MTTSIVCLIERLKMKIAIASGKGGTGKTTVATNLAKYLSENRKVVLVDLDVEEPNSGLFLNGSLMNQKEMFKKIPNWESENCTLCGKCQSVCNFNAIMKLGENIMVFPELCHSCYACSELCPTQSLPMIPMKMGMLTEYKVEQLGFVGSKLDIGQEQAVPLIAQTLDYVDEMYSDDYLKLYDAPPGTSCPVIEATKDADFIFLVTEPTPFGLHDMKLAVETMRELKKPMAVIINRYGIGDAEVEAYCKVEGIDIIANFPNQRYIAELYSQGKLIYPHVPEFKAELLKAADYCKHLVKEN